MVYLEAKTDLLTDMERTRTVFLPTDLLCIGLNLFFGIVSLFFAGQLQVVLFGVSLDRELLVGLGLLLSPVLILFLLRLAARKPGNSVAGFFRLFYVQAFYILYFTETIYLSQLISGGASFDPFFAELDRLLFGAEPAVLLPGLLGGAAWFTELMFFSYFFFYALITVGWWILFFRGRREAAVKALFITTASFTILYLWYLAFPVHGPKYYVPALHNLWYSNFHGYFFTELMKSLFAHTNLAGAAFPSSHVAISVVALALNWKQNRFLIPLFLPMTALLFVSTVFLYAHYVVDVIAGLIAGGLLYVLVPRSYPTVTRLAGRINRLLE